MKGSSKGKCLWAPWRMEYIKEQKREGCIFCVSYHEKGRERDNLLLYRNASSFVIMNRFPYAHGHLMVVPAKHVNTLEGLSQNELLDLMLVLRQTLSILKETLNPEGFNIGINIGDVAGAGYADHLHIHVVPRWKGDMNFMPVLADTTVMSEHLAETFDKLHRLFGSGGNSGNRGNQ